MGQAVQHISLKGLVLSTQAWERSIFAIFLPYFCHICQGYSTQACVTSFSDNMLTEELGCSGVIKMCVLPKWRHTIKYATCQDDVDNHQNRGMLKMLNTCVFWFYWGRDAMSTPWRVNLLQITGAILQWKYRFFFIRDEFFRHIIHNIYGTSNRPSLHVYIIRNNGIFRYHNTKIICHLRKSSKRCPKKNLQCACVQGLTYDSPWWRPHVQYKRLVCSSFRTKTSPDWSNLSVYRSLVTL
jgi:hypothetical protein